MLKLKKKSVLWAVRSIQKYFDTYIFPMPFEYEAIKYDQDAVVDYITDLDVLNEGIRDYRTLLTPKSVKGFRVATQLDPIDSIISLALIYEIADDIERARLPKNQQTVYSFRIKPEKNGTLYDPDFTWGSFLDRAREITDSGEFTHVLITDISDFYPSIYFHDIETVVGEAVKQSGRATHANVLFNYLRAMHLNQTHKGLPVGPQFSRPIAELILDEIDRTLLEKGVQYIRYVDDFVVFSKSEADAYVTLSVLAQTLYDRRNLKLNEQKTEIISIDEYKQKYLTTTDELENNTILESFSELLYELGIDQDPYEEIEPEDISDEDWERLRSVNLRLLLEQELSKRQPDSFIVSFSLANLARLDNTDIADLILSEKSIYKLFPKLRSIINYLERVRSFSKEQKQAIGAKVLDLVEKSFVSTLDFNRMWFMHLFTKTNEWDNADRFKIIYERYSNNATLRKTLLARGRAHDIDFFRHHKSDNLDTNNWVRRAFIAAVSCLPEPERKPWYKARSLRSRDFLDRVVEKWAEKNHF